MAGMYRIEDLLKLVLRERAEELHLQVDQSPIMIVGGKERAIDILALTSDNVTELFQAIATQDQLKELRACGKIHFIHLFQHSARFSVSAHMQHESFDVKIKNLSR